MLWTCEKCGEKIPMTRDEFPIRCSCGAVDTGEEFVSLGLGDTIAKFTRRLGLSSCSGCKRRQAALNRWFPYRRRLSKQRCDVLNCYPPLDDPEWIKIRGDVYAAELRTAGLKALSVGVHSKTSKAAGAAIADHNPRVFVNHAFFFGWEVIAELAEIFPKTTFLTINHSSQADLIRAPDWLSEHAHSVELAQRRENVFVASVDPRNFMSRCGLERCLWVPNLVRWPRWPASHKLKSDRPVASIIGRHDPNKAIPHSIIAASINGRVDLLFMLKNPRRDQLEDYCESLRVSCEFAPWSSWEDYTKTLFERVSVGFQPSFSESFNYVSVEQMALGIPVIGSPTIQFLPPEWQANPDDPLDIAEKLDTILDDYETQSRRAVDIAAEVKKKNYTQAVNIYKQLVNKGA